MSIYDYITPSDQAAALGLLVNRARAKAAAKDTISVLVVEGGTDRGLLSPHCTPTGQVFEAGDRSLVEGMLRHLRAEPIPGCACAFLIDCDGAGKTSDLLSEGALLVTETCDMEADLVRIGVATRVAERFSADEQAAVEFVSHACDIALPISSVRRAANAVAVSMKREGQQFRAHELPGHVLDAWDRSPPEAADALDVIAQELRWANRQTERVASRLAGIPTDFDRVCLGKDALDVLFELLVRHGTGDVRGWNCDHFHKVVRQALRIEDFSNWEVGRRLFQWQQSARVTLVDTSSPDGGAPAPVAGS